MSNPTNIPAFRPTAFDTVANNFWQDFVLGNPIGGGAAYENKLRECQLDGSLESLKQLDRLLLAIKKDLQKRNYDEKLVLQQNSFRNLLLFIMFYTGRVASNELGERGSWQPIAHLEQYYPNIVFGGQDNKFYYLSAFFPNSFLANPSIPPMFVLLTLGAKLFGNFERKFAEPLTGELVSESLYWAVAGYVHIVGSFRATPITLPHLLGAAPAPALPAPNIPSKIAQTAPRPINKSEPARPMPPSEPIILPPLIESEPAPAIPRAIMATAPHAPARQTAKSAQQSAPSALPENHTTPQNAMIKNRLAQAGLLPEQSVQKTPVQQNLAEHQRMIEQSQVRPPVSQNVAHQTPRLHNSAHQELVNQDSISQNTVRQTPILQNSPAKPAPHPQPLVQPQPKEMGLTPHQLAEQRLAGQQRQAKKPVPETGVQLSMRTDPPKNPAPPPAPIHKQHPFQAGGLAPMSLAPPLVTVKSTTEPTKPQKPTSSPAPAAKAPVSNPANAVGSAADKPVATANGQTAQSLPVQPKAETAIPQPATPSAKQPAPSAPKAPPKILSDASVFAEIAQDLVNLPAANTRADAEFQKAKAALDNYDKMIAERVAQGQTMISFSEEELMELQRTVGFIKKMANSGNTNAMIAYGLCCFKGVAMPQDMEQGAIWIHKAADVNDMRAQKLLSRLYYQGLGVEQSIRQGEHWLEKAAKSGHPEAQKVQAQFAKVKTMKEDYHNETQKDKRYALIFIVMGLFLVVALGAVALFL